MYQNTFATYFGIVATGASQAIDVNILRQRLGADALSLVQKTDAEGQRTGVFHLLARFFKQACQTEVVSRLFSATALRVQECYTAENGQRAGGDMKGILSVRGIFASNFPDSDVLADRVHCGLFRALYEGTTEKLQANLDYQRALFGETAALRARVGELEAAAGGGTAVEALQKALEKSKQTRARELQEIGELSARIVGLERQKADLASGIVGVRHAELERRTELAAAQAEIARLRAELEALEKEPAVGAKRARSEADWGAESEIVRMLLGQLAEARAASDGKDQRLLEKDELLQEKDAALERARAALDEARREAGEARVLLERSRAAARTAETRARGLEADNEAKVEAHEKLRRSAKKGATTMGHGTSAWAAFLELDLTRRAGVRAARALQESLRETVRLTHRGAYLALANVPALRPFSQAALDSWLQRHDAPPPAPEEP